MDFKLILILVTIMLTSVTALYIYSRYSEGVVQKSYLLLITTFIVWAVIRVVVYTTQDAGIALIFERSAYIVGILIAWAFFNFAYQFAYRAPRISTAYVRALALLSLIPVMQSFTNYFIRKAFLGSSGAFFDISFPLLVLYDVVFIMVFGYAFHLLVQKFFESSGETRVSLRYVVISTLIAVAGGFTVNLFHPLLGEFRYQVLGPSFTIFFTLAVAYLIIRSRK